MSVRPEIPDVQGVKDESAAKILKALKSAFDSITGRSQPRIKTLGASANFFGTVKKVNEIINRIQSDIGPELGAVTTIPDQTSASGIAGTGSVTSVGQSFTGGLISVSGSPITTSGTLALTVAGTSGGVPYFSSAAAWASSGALTASALVLGGGAGAAPTSLASLGTTTTLLHGNAAGAPTWGAVSLTADVTGTLAVGNGGTGAATLADGGLVIGNATGAVEVVAAGLTTQILVGGGALTAPVWGTDLPTAITIGAAYIYRGSGTDVVVADGGTGLSTLTASALYVGNGTAAPTALAVGATNTFLKGSTGANPAFGTATLASADFANQGTATTVLHGNAAGNPSWSSISLTADVSGLLPMANMAGIQYYAAVHG